MRQIFPEIPNLQRNPWLIALALLYGAASGLFVGGYWLSPLFPVGSQQLILLTIVAAILGAAVYWAILVFGARRFVNLSVRVRLGMIGAAVIAGILLFFGGTSQWLSPAQYVTFLLPSHHLQIRAAEGHGSNNLTLLWFTSSVGDISYDSLRLKGWKRTGDQLNLESLGDNSLEWFGRTGSDVQLVFRAGGADDKLKISWDSEEQVVSLAPGRFTYQHTFDVPWYASAGLIAALGLFVFSTLALVLIAFLWEKRYAIIAGLRDSVSPRSEGLNRTDAAFIIGAIALALMLRIPNLGRSYPAVDEYFHLIAARQIVEGASLSSVYERGLWLVTLPISLALRAFGYQLWAARLVGVLFNGAAILPLYLLTSKVNRPIAVLSALLFATSPWVITFARITREYAYYPFYFYWITLGMVTVIEGIPERFIVVRDWRRLLTPRMMIVGFALLIPPLFAFYGDRLSTFRTILIAYLIFGIFLLARFHLTDRSNLPILAILGGGLLVTAYVWYQHQSSKVVVIPRFNSVPVEYFLPDAQQQWYFGRLVPLVVLGLLAAALCSYIIRRVNIVPLFVLGLYLTYLAFFAFFSKTFFHTRHLSTTELWYVIVLASGLYFIWKIIKAVRPWRTQLTGAVIAVVLGLSVINVQQVLVPITLENPDNPISEDYQHDMSKVHAFMLGQAQPGDVLISTVYGLYSSWQEEPQLAARYRITTDTPRNEIFSLIEQHESGWIVIDQIRLAMSTLGPREFAENPDVKYIGLFGDQNVWHWQHLPTGLGKTAVAEKRQ